MQGQLAIEMGKQVTFTAPQIKAFLYSLKRGDVNDENNRRGMVNIFLRAIYLYDDRMTLILNGGDRPITVTIFCWTRLRNTLKVPFPAMRGVHRWLRSLHQTGKIRTRWVRIFCSAKFFIPPNGNRTNTCYHQYGIVIQIHRAG